MNRREFLFSTADIFLTHMPKRETEPLVAREGKLDPEMLGRHDSIVGQVRKDGLAISKGHLFRGFSAIAAPIFDHTGSLAGSITLLGIGSQIDRSPGGPVATQVRQAAHKLSQELGCPQ
jgi:DNA-binding IclR family transcriptional regulator